MAVLTLLWLQDPVTSPPHFPDRLHAFVFRNWPLVAAETMANVVGAPSPEDIRRLGGSMGLAAPRQIPDQRRSYITIIRRNWHLLPNGQIVKLLDWTRERFAYTLREDDFLEHKLGPKPPNLEPLGFARTAPPAAAAAAAAAVAKVVAEMPPAGNEALFAFVEKLSEPVEFKPPEKKSPLSPRFCASYFAPYGDPLLKETDPYPDGYLTRLANAGVDGVWLQAVLYTLAPLPWDPKLSDRFEERRANLRELVARARKRGIGIYLYFNEPRAMPLSFFEKFPDLRGTAERTHAALCTSHPEVQKYLRGSVASICKAVPDLAGVFTITASENLTNCWSHFGGAKCPRCSKRSEPAVIAEVNGLIHEGIREGSATTNLIVWDWGWRSEKAIELLPADAWLMSVSEWDLPIERGGVKGTVGEYSISAVGPGPRALRHWAIAKQRGMKTIAKIQANNSWELSAVPYIPAYTLVGLHAAKLRDRVDGLMLGWTLGGYPSLNLRIACGTAPPPPQEDAASVAFRKFPFNVGVVYSAPLQMGPANLLYEKATGRTATMVGFPFDDLDRWRGPYPEEIFISHLDQVADGFFNSDDPMAEACAIHFRSVANQSRFVLARKSGDRDAMRAALKDEIRLARRLYGLQTRDSRLGFEASNHYYYVPIDLVEKVLNCRHLLGR